MPQLICIRILLAFVDLSSLYQWTCDICIVNHVIFYVFLRWQCNCTFLFLWTNGSCWCSIWGEKTAIENHGDLFYKTNRKNRMTRCILGVNHGYQFLLIEQKRRTWKHQDLSCVSSSFIWTIPGLRFHLIKGQISSSRVSSFRNSMRTILCSTRIPSQAW